jgi:glycosyltransferase involved in cell wall biosynthesis
MRILLYSNHAPLNDHLFGGAHQLVHDLLRGMTARGVEVDLLCARTERTDLLDVGPRLRIAAELEGGGERDPRPEEVHRNLRRVALHVRRCDVVVTVDRPFPLQCLRPVILLLYNFSYRDSVQSVFAFTWDSVIVPSDYLATAVASVAGPAFWRGGERPIVTLRPGIDVDHFRASPDAAGALRARLGLDGSSRCLWFPHRLDPRKGLEAALRALAELRRKGDDYRLLVPAQPETALQAAYLDRVRRMVRRHRLDDAVVLHRWVPYSDLPAYFSLADGCLAPSTLPEGFGLTPLQAVSCGTPVVAAPAGAMPRLLPAGCGMTLVGAAAVDHIVAAVRQPPDSAALARGRRVIAEQYALSRYLDEVVRHLEGARRSNAVYDPDGSPSSRAALPR